MYQNFQENVLCGHTGWSNFNVFLIKNENLLTKTLLRFFYYFSFN